MQEMKEMATFFHSSHTGNSEVTLKIINRERERNVQSMEVSLGILVPIYNTCLLTASTLSFNFSPRLFSSCHQINQYGACAAVCYICQ